MPKIINENNDLISPAIILDNDTIQLEIGVDGNDSNLVKLSVQSSAGATFGNPMITFDSSVNGNVTLTPNGSGTIIGSYLTDGVVVSDSSGSLTSSVGTDGQLLIGATGAGPAWSDLTSVGGSIVFTQGSNSLNLESTGGTTTGLIQTVSNSLNTVFTTTAIIPYDDTIPQNTEGDELLTVSITPTKSANKLYIYAAFVVSAGVSSTTECTVALFQDSTADALAATGFDIQDGPNNNVSLTHIMSAGTTSATTFKLRIGSVGGQDIIINGDSSSTRIYGGVCKVVFYVQEISTGLTTVPSAFPWTVVPGTSQSLVTQNGYFANNAGTVTFTLPAAADVGDTYEIVEMHASGNWSVAQNAGQQMFFGNTSTTAGVGGSISGGTTGDGIRIVCRVANTEFQVFETQGNPLTIL
jgi:hypothetical protein